MTVIKPVLAILATLLHAIITGALFLWGCLVFVIVGLAVLFVIGLLLAGPLDRLGRSMFT